ncbi:MAG: PEGA domain-containing protein [Leptospirillia bacterium]
MKWIAARKLMLGLLLGTALTAAGCASAPAPPPVLTSHTGQGGGLQFLIVPDDAKVYVDAEYQGRVSEFRGENVLWLPRGLHAVEVSKDGYVTFFRQVQITLGLVEVLIYTLPERDG